MHESICVGGGRVSTTFVVAGRLQTCVQEMGCQLVLKYGMHHQLCDSPGQGGRGLMDPGKFFLNGGCGCRGGPQPLGSC